MTSTQSPLLKRAKQGDVRAITALINRSLEPKGITAYVSQSQSQLTITLESLKNFEARPIVAWLERSLRSLDSPTIADVDIRTRVPGKSTVLWTEHLHLRDLEPEIETDFSPEEPAAPIMPSVPVETTKERDRKPLPYTFQTVLLTIKTCFADPFSLPDVSERLHRKTAFNIGLSLGLVYLFGVLFGINNTTGTALNVVMPGFALPLVVIFNFAGFVLANTLVRKLFRGQGSMEGDCFIIGCTLMLTGIYVATASLLGVTNFEVIILLSLLYVVYSILILYVGCVRISKIAAPIAPLAVVTIFALGTYLTKVMVSIGFSPSPSGLF